jgi:hypothetical protein
LPDVDVDGQGSAGVRVGVTGHRTFAEVAAVSALVDDVLARLGEPGRVITSLAEGADRLVAERAARRPGWAHEVVLPLDPVDYETDFADGASVAEFRRLLASAVERHRVPPAGTREDAYLAAGIEVLDRSEALLAIWDGQGARGRGGTAEIVAEARARALPLTWVHVGRSVPVMPSCTQERWPWMP